MAEQFTHPPVDWEFNNFIANICKLLNEKDLDQIKLRYKGIIEAEVGTVAAAFHLLMVKGYITQNNLIYLQVILRVLDRPDLLARTIEYACKTNRRVLHFEETRAEIRPGHEIVRFHVSGTGNQTRDDLHAIRCTISQILWISIEDIVFRGVEASNSVYITFTLPKFFVATLKKLLENESSRSLLTPFKVLGIDEIIVSEVRFSLHLEDNQGQYESPPSDGSLQILQKDLQQKTCQIKMLEEECLRLKRFNQTTNKSKSEQNVRKRKLQPELRRIYKRKAKFRANRRLIVPEKTKICLLCHRRNKVRQRNRKNGLKKSKIS